MVSWGRGANTLAHSTLTTCRPRITAARFGPSRLAAPPRDRQKYRFAWRIQTTAAPPKRVSHQLTERRRCGDAKGQCPERGNEGRDLGAAGPGLSEREIGRQLGLGGVVQRPVEAASESATVRRRHAEHSRVSRKRELGRLVPHVPTRSAVEGTLSGHRVAVAISRFASGACARAPLMREGSDSQGCATAVAPQVAHQ